MLRLKIGVLVGSDDKGVINARAVPLCARVVPFCAEVVLFCARV